MSALDDAKKFVHCKPRCSVKAFSVPEWAKERRRPIFWPDINTSIDRSLLLKDFIPLRREVRQKVAESKWSIQYDFASWYDQLPLHPEISPFFSVNGSTCLGSLPMGFRPSAEVAQLVSQSIADFPLPKGVSVVVYIDNIRFGGNEKEKVEEAAREFLRRVDLVGGILNGCDVIATQKEDFLGEHFNLVKGTRCLTKNTVEKVKTALQVAPSQLSFRQVAAIFGLLFYGIEVLNISLAPYYQALRYYRSTMAIVTSWNAKAPPMSKTALAQLSSCLKLMKHNVPTHIWKEENSFPDLTIYCDASAAGWGAVCISSAGIHEAGAAWTTAEKNQHNVQLSTVAEPLAVMKAVSSFVSSGCANVKVMSDHMGLVFAGNAGYGKSEEYNTMCFHLLTKFTHTHFSFGFIPGAQNVLADSLSRRYTSYKTANKHN